MVDDRWVYLTDGGHLDNLGHGRGRPARPRARSSPQREQRPAGTWQDVGAAVSVIRADLGIDLG